VFSKTLTKVDWKNTKLVKEIKRDEVLNLKQKPGKNIIVGSPSIVSTLTQLGLIDEYRFLVHPMIPGNGKRFFENTKMINPGN